MHEEHEESLYIPHWNRWHLAGMAVLIACPALVLLLLIGILS
jgi:hypothetical protein